jgi:hypothetical protein
MERLPFLPVKIKRPPTWVDSGVKEDVLQAAIAHPPDARFADDKELHTARIPSLKIIKVPLEVLPGEGLAQRRHPFLSHMRMGSELVRLEEHDIAPP